MLVYVPMMMWPIDDGLCSTDDAEPAAFGRRLVAWPFFVVVWNARACYVFDDEDYGVALEIKA